MITVDVLDKEVHRQLVDDLDRYAGIAGISAKMVGESVNGYLTKPEIDWLRGIKPLLKQGDANYCFIGNKEGEQPISTKMMAITGCLMRNFIDARMKSLLNVVEDEDASLVPTVLLIPDFLVAGGGDGKPLAPWQTMKLHSVLLNRLCDNKGTIIFTSHLKKVRECYGAGVSDLIQTHYKLGE